MGRPHRSRSWCSATCPRVHNGGHRQWFANGYATDNWNGTDVVDVGVRDWMSDPFRLSPLKERPALSTALEVCARARKREPRPPGGRGRGSWCRPDEAQMKSFSTQDFSGCTTLAGEATPVAPAREGRRPSAMLGLMW